MVLNPLHQLHKYFTKDVWRRHHEKLIVSDSNSIIGSSNLEGSYAGINYGSSVYRDLNFCSENIILDQFRKHFIDTANFYRFNLNSGNEDDFHFASANLELLLKYNKQYPNSEFYPEGMYRLLHNDQKKKQREI